MTMSSGPLAALRFLSTNGKWLAVSAFTMCVFAMVALYGQLNGSDSYIATRVRTDIAAAGQGVDYAREVLSIRQLTVKQRPRQQLQDGAAAAQPSWQRAVRSPLAAAGGLEELGARDRNASLAAAASAAAVTASYDRQGDKGSWFLGSRIASSAAAAVKDVGNAVEGGAAYAPANRDSANLDAAPVGGMEHRSTRARPRRARTSTTTVTPPAADMTATGSIPPDLAADANRMPALAAVDAAAIPVHPAALRDHVHAGRGNASRPLDGVNSGAEGRGSLRAGVANSVSAVPKLAAADPPLLVPWPVANGRDGLPTSAAHRQDFRDRELGRRTDYYAGAPSFVRGTTGPPPPPIHQWETYDYESAVAVLDIHVEHAPDVMSMSVGEPWPMPQHYLTSHTYHAVDLAAFKFVPAASAASKPLATPPGTVPPAAVPWCDRLQRAIVRYTAIVKESVGMVTAPTIASALPHNTLSISLLTPCSDQSLPHERMDESYYLRVDAHAMQLTAVEIWGILRGLETFSQLLHIRDGLAVINETVIRDYPSYGYRGVMLDTARHFLPMQHIKRSLDAMSYNKFNVFHWHIVDDNSFPYESKKFPNLHKKGAYSSSQVYSVADVQEIIAYAADRGIRVIPEFDTPGHTRSWGNAYPTLLTNCSADYDPFGAVNPIGQFTYDFLAAFFDEVKSVFPDSYMHIGGDEINYKCWLAVKEIREFMLAHNMTVSEYQYSGSTIQRLNGKQLQGYYTERLLAAMPPNTKKIAWDEAFLAAVQQNLSRSDLVIHVWQQGDMWQQLASQVLNEGFSVIVSACWYLNYISYGIDWHKYYECDLKSFEKYYNIVPEKRAGMLGGSVCLWSEHIDENNLEPILWPRAIAPAEKLWSSELLVSPTAAQGRFEQQHCRLLRRGVHAAPGNGPGSCLGSMKVKPPM